MSGSSVLEPLPHMCESLDSVFSIKNKLNWSEKYITSSVLWLHWVSHSWSKHCTEEQAKILSGTYGWVCGFSGLQKNGTFSLSHEQLWITGPESALPLGKIKMVVFSILLQTEPSIHMFTRFPRYPSKLFPGQKLTYFACLYLIDFIS